MKPRPGFIDHGYIDANRGQSLRLLLVESRFLEIAGISVIHARHVKGRRVAWAEGDRLLSGRHRLVMATLKYANIADGDVSFAATGVSPQSPRGAGQCREAYITIGYVRIF